MTRIERDEEREQRIRNRATVDAYTPEEQVMGWYCYLEDKIRFRFNARCTEEKTVSPLQEGETVRVLEMVPANDVSGGMFVTVEWSGREMGVPLEQLEPVDVDSDSEEAIRDWHYWKARGHQLP